MKRKLKKALKLVNPKNWNEKVKFVVASFVFLAAVAIFLTWFLEYRFFENDFEKTWNFVFGKWTKAAFWYSCLIVWLGLLFIWAICGRTILTAAFATVVFFIITFIQVAKNNARGFPLLPEDFQLAGEAGTLTKFVDIGAIVRLIIAIIIVCVLFALLSRYFGFKLHLRYRGKKEQNIVFRHLFITRAAILVIASFCLVVSTDFARNNTGERYENTFLNTIFTAWSQKDNYRDNGFLIGFLYNLQKLKLEAPSEYGEERISNIKNEYDIIAKTENEKRLNPADEDVSVVVILDESYFDPSVEFQGKKFSDYYNITSGDLTPELHRIQKEAASGKMYSLDYGGGTANIEFEVLTSLTNFWTRTIPYTSLLPKTEKVSSIASMLKPLDYTTLAIHPFNGGMYKRNIAIKKEGFDTFMTEVEIEDTKHDESSAYTSDEVTYDETLKALQSTGDRQVIGVITMQNHTPYYPSEKSRNTINVETSEQISDDKKDELGAYLYSLHRSDKHLGDFIDKLKTLDKKVAVLFFGDHSPGVFPIVNDSTDKEVHDLSRVTPYFIWTNYETDIAGKELPTTSPNCLTNTMLNILRWKKDSIYYLVDKVCAEQPILAESYLDSSKEFEMTKALKEYQLASYDILAGKQYWYSE